MNDWPERWNGWAYTAKGILALLLVVVLITLITYNWFAIGRFIGGR